MPKCNHKWKELEDLYAITRLEKKDDKVTFLPTTGVPIVISICLTCGEIKIFSAKLKGKI